MHSATVVSRTALRSALQAWHVVTVLGESELANLEIVRDRAPHDAATPAQLGLILRSELEAALQELHQTYRLAAGEERTYYTLLTERYVASRSISAVSGLINVERTEYYRRLNAAFDALASLLNAKELRLRSARAKANELPGALSETRPIFQAPLPMGDRLVGRDHMLSLLKERLAAGRNTALLGIPGVGKTSLALALAYDPEVRRRYGDGVLWANLGVAPDPLSTLKQWGRELGVPMDVISAAPPEALARRVHERIGLKALLIIIDDVWDVGSAMLLKVGGIHCHHVITTRLLDVAVALADESGPFRIEELPLDESITLLSHYVDERSLSGFGISLESLAQASGGLPLALMLTGRLLSQAMHSGMERRFRSLLHALQDPSERLRLSVPVGPNDGAGDTSGRLSVFAQIAATERVLSEEAKGALTGLGAFLPKPHSFSAEAAQTVCDCSIEAIDELVAFGLLETKPGDRFTLHQSISEYARARLNDQTVWQRLVTWYADYAETHEANFIALDAEWDNIQYALGVAQDRGHLPDVLRASHALAPFLLSRNMSERAYRLLSETLPLCRQSERPAVLAQHMVLLVRTALHAKELDQADRAVQEAVHICSENTEAGNLLPIACEIAAMVASATGKAEEALQWYVRALEAAQRTRQVYLIPRMLVNMERLEIGSDHRQSLLSAAVLQPPVWQKAFSKMHIWLRIQPKLLTSGALRLWIKGVRLAVTGETAGGMAALHQAAEEARAAGDPEALVTALGFYSLLCMGTGDYVSAERCAVEGLPLRASAIFPRSVGFLYSSYAISQLYRGNLGRANALINEGLAYARADGSFESESWLSGMGSVIRLAGGDAQAAYQIAFEGISLSQRSGVLDVLPYSTAMCGLALAHLQQYDRAWQYFKESVTDVSAFNDVWARAFSWICYGEGLLLAGNLNTAQENLQQGLELAQQIGAVPHAARAQLALAQTVLAAGDREAARHYAEQSYHNFMRVEDIRARDVIWWANDQLGSVSGITSDEEGHTADGPHADPVKPLG